MATHIELQNIWVAPGYRDLTLRCIDPATKKQYELRIPASGMQHLINECADAVKQIGIDPPIDWDLHPTQIYWPTVTPWKVGPTPKKPEAP
jgi:hypothetical protein